MTDTAAKIAYNDAAPADERRDAQTELQKAALDPASVNVERMLPMVEFMRDQYEQQEFAKALAKPNIIPFPSRAVREKEPGMQSVWLDDRQFALVGDWYERPTAFSFQNMRAMVDQTPILSAVIFTRLRQIDRFCRVQGAGKGPGFRIALKDDKAKAGEEENQSILLLQDFFLNCGWEAKPRQRMRLKRDNFSGFMAKLVRDSLTMDSAPIETEWKRDKTLGLDGLYAVDGGTIRLCSEDGYRGDDEIFSLQVVEGNIRSVYTYDDLIYVPRNPRTDVTVGGYGFAETELLVRTVTGFLNAFTYNTKFFDSNQIPKGLLHLTGNYDDKDLAAFRRYWNAMVKGINNAWTLPVMISKDQESKASFENFGVEVNEIMFAKWMTFLTSIICAIYGIAPDEINFESFTAGTSSLSGDDTEEKLANSKDKGLRPLLSYFENLFSDFIVAEFSDKYVFRWTGLDEEDEQRAFERQKLAMTWDEMRAIDGLDPVGGKIGTAPINPSLIGVWQAENQAQEQDFGQPGQGQPGAPGDDDDDDGEDFGSPGGENDTGANFGKPPADDDGQDDGAAGGEELQKAFGLPVFRIEP
ncbi:portal protein [Bordetella phage vB_BbrM_PHB04]|uniref:Portal protein n=1 Tax=Bordetella phage vB_BbrM_PHB04 TaxID=2029657 RepID=A0A291LA38_9CAUD|nr:portal protein [Bordetella phage vB_BbrM_PHB04]ATI15653.1 portal protein [Bordetella phage vB_BbrM_PHB04]